MHTTSPRRQLSIAANCRQVLTIFTASLAAVFVMLPQRSAAQIGHKLLCKEIATLDHGADQIHSSFLDQEHPGLFAVRSGSAVRVYQATNRESSPAIIRSTQLQLVTPDSNWWYRQWYNKAQLELNSSMAFINNTLAIGYDAQAALTSYECRQWSYNLWNYYGCNTLGGFKSISNLRKIDLLPLGGSGSSGFEDAASGGTRWPYKNWWGRYCSFSSQEYQLGRFITAANGKLVALNNHEGGEGFCCDHCTGRSSASGRFYDIIDGRQSLQGTWEFPDPLAVFTDEDGNRVEFGPDVPENPLFIGVETHDVLGLAGHPLAGSYVMAVDFDSPFKLSDGRQVQTSGLLVYDSEGNYKGVASTFDVFVSGTHLGKNNSVTAAGYYRDSEENIVPVFAAGSPTRSIINFSPSDLFGSGESKGGFLSELFSGTNAKVWEETWKASFNPEAGLVAFVNDRAEIVDLQTGFKSGDEFGAAVAGIGTGDEQFSLAAVGAPGGGYVAAITMQKDAIHRRVIAEGNAADEFGKQLGTVDINNDGLADILIVGSKSQTKLYDLDICADLCPNDPRKYTPGICGCGTPESDWDGDGTPNCVDECPRDPNKVEGGICGCGEADLDSDQDGVYDCLDECPTDAASSAAGACGCGQTEMDSDGDSVPDCSDFCPDDAAKIVPGECGCGSTEFDLNENSIADCLDAETAQLPAPIVIKKQNGKRVIVRVPFKGKSRVTLNLTADLGPLGQATLKRRQKNKSTFVLRRLPDAQWSVWYSATVRKERLSSPVVQFSVP